MKVDIVKMDETTWKVWNEEMEMVEIKKCEDNGVLGKGTFYRVDRMDGRTIVTLMSHFQTAKKKAFDYLKNNL